MIQNSSKTENGSVVGVFCLFVCLFVCFFLADWLDAHVYRQEFRFTFCIANLIVLGFSS